MLAIGFNPALHITLKSYFTPLKMSILWEVLGIGIPASVESVLFNGGKLLTQMFVAGMGTNVIAGNFIAFSIASLINLPGNALGSASTIIVGRRLGKGEIGQAERQLRHIFLAVYPWVDRYRLGHGAVGRGIRRVLYLAG
ncbi:MATE family multidrug exporter [Serratia marcescens]|uniref:MATE family multidrug exporter n=1 Tax=Serratia marcescens TaxID=615 RepID=A0A379Z714_SERMA|nr:MATE family multidrug exporter [Serratia marcescens]